VVSLALFVSFHHSPCSFLVLGVRKKYENDFKERNFIGAVTVREIGRVEEVSEREREIKKSFF
jgi:hypothetical protein